MKKRSFNNIYANAKSKSTEILSKLKRSASSFFTPTIPVETNCILPDELLLQIFLLLQPEDLFYCIPLVCKKFKRISEDNEIWVNFAAKEWKKNSKSSMKKKYLYWIRDQAKRRINGLSTFTRGTQLATKIRVGIIGDTFVGKTTLRNRICNLGDNSNAISNNKETVDIKITDTEVISFDFSNTEGSYTIDKNYFIEMALILLCYDTTCTDSLESIKAWLSIIERHTTIGIYLIGTKCESMIENSELKNYCTDLKFDKKIVDYCEASAIENINIDKIRQNIIEYRNKLYIPFPTILPNTTFFESKILF